METIYAPATAPGRAAVAVLRLSGPDAGAILTALTGRPLPRPRRAVLARLRDPADPADRIDRALALWFPAPASFTGEDVVELHLHGGRAVLDALVAAIGADGRARLAEPGEFTRRAFLNHKLDLTEAEAVADLVDAETRAQARQALRQLDGALGRLYGDWARRLTRLLAHLEADLDFPDEDLPGGVAASVAPEVDRLIAEIAAHLDDARRGERLREGVEIAIIGPPNAGKSSLLNALARRDAAIVSAIPGTTRDVIEVQLDLGGYPVVLADTAGLRETADAIEDEGIRRALARAERADLSLVVLDAAGGPDALDAVRRRLSAEALLVLNKADRVTEALRAAWDRALAAEGVPPAAVAWLSVTTGDGLKPLLSAVTGRVAALVGGGTGAPLTRARHREALEYAKAALERFRAAPLPELAAEDVRLAVRALGRITGRVDVEDLLDVIFRDFCIGK